MAAELYLHNGLTQRAIGELLGWNIANVNQWISRWLESIRRELVTWETMQAHGGSGYYYVNPASWGRPDPQPLSAEQQQRADALRQARIAKGWRPHPKPQRLPTSPEWRHAVALLRAWPG